MKLTDAQRGRILRRNYPHLKLEPDEAKALIPQTITINQQVWVEVRGARRDKKAGWFVDYVVHDYRPRFMKRGTGHTHAIQLAVAGEGEDVVPDEYQEELRVRAERKQESFNRENRIEDVTRQDVQRLNAEIRELAKRAIKMGVDPTVVLAPVVQAVKREHIGLRDAA